MENEKSTTVLSRVIQAIRSMITHLVQRGTEGMPENAARKLRNGNIALMCILPTVFAVTVSLYLQGEYWRAAAYENTAFFLAAALIFALRPRRYWIKSAAVFLWLIVFILYTLRFGLYDGIRYFLLIAPAFLFLTLEVRFWRSIAVVTALCGAVFLVTDLFLPWRIDRTEDFWTVAWNSLKPLWGDDPWTMDDTMYTVQVLAMQAGLYLICRSTFSTLEAAETALQREHRRSEALLQAVLPRRIAERLKQEPQRTIADSVPNATVLFCDLANFTAVAGHHSAMETVDFLNLLFSDFDARVHAHGLEKIKTIGDAYMVAGGLNEADDRDHPQRMADLALDMIDITSRRAAAFDPRISLRVGIHTGPVVAGVIGATRPFYDVWGDTVNVASRMEATARTGTAQITPELMDILRENFECEQQPQVNVRGKGVVAPYVLVRRRISHDQDR